mmetsp:Transcript_17908/g.69396  ORF Transcript_17908/g.69396 Transcript_17908/m.69396 type:complete len:229 (-) Transcript_17908:2112-2798(-)
MMTEVTFSMTSASLFSFSEQSEVRRASALRRTFTLLLVDSTALSLGITACRTILSLFCALPAHTASIAPSVFSITSSLFVAFSTCARSGITPSTVTRPRLPSSVTFQIADMMSAMMGESPSLRWRRSDTMAVTPPSMVTTALLSEVSTQLRRSRSIMRSTASPHWRLLRNCRMMKGRMPSVVSRFFAFSYEEVMFTSALAAWYTSSPFVLRRRARRGGRAPWVMRRCL